MLLLDEEKLSGLSNTKRTRYLLQWLQKLPGSIRDCSKVILISACCPSPPAFCLTSTVFMSINEVFWWLLCRRN